MKHILFIALVIPLTAVGQPAPVGEAAWGGWRDGAAEPVASWTADGRPALVYVHAPTCGPCRRMERDVFSPAAPLLARLNRIGLDLSDHDAPHPGAPSPADRARALGAAATPSFILIAPDGAPLAHATGFLDAQAFTLLLAYAATGAYRHASFAAYVERTTGGLPTP